MPSDVTTSQVTKKSPNPGCFFLKQVVSVHQKLQFDGEISWQFRVFPIEEDILPKHCFISVISVWWNISLCSFTDWHNSQQPC